MMKPENERVDVAKVDKLYEKIRKKVLDKVTVRRTRENIRKNFPEDFVTINFPVIEKPREIEYLLHDELKELFEQTVLVLTNEKQTGLKYARYKAIERFTGEYAGIYDNAEKISANLAQIYKTHMVKRLESSFHAFRISLKNLAGATQGMLDMFAADKVIIAPEWKVKDLQREGKDIEEIIRLGIDKFGEKSDKFAVYPANAFDPAFVEDLKYDLELLKGQIALWEKVTIDPKFERFVEYLQTQVFDKKLNPTGKLVVFSESKDTVMHLNDELKKRIDQGIIAVSSEDRKKLFETIQENFDANIADDKKKNDIDIIISTDVLAEGVNLHRANVIVNYDTPWNASRLMQRIGRVNRIGSVAGTIVNYMFYPSAEGDKEIRLYKNALTKLQGFHSAYGEDSQIFSREEVVQQFEFADHNASSDDVDTNLELMREARDFYKNNPEEYNRIKQLPDKSRTGRKANANIKAGSSLVFVSSPYKASYYKVDRGAVHSIDFLEAAKLFKASIEERSEPLPSSHYSQISSAQRCYDEEVVKMLDENSKVDKNEYNDKDLKKDGIVRKFLIELSKRTTDETIPAKCDILISYIEKGTYSALSRKYQRLKKIHWATEKLPLSDIESLEKQVRADVAKYHSAKSKKAAVIDDVTARIILSETFV